MNSKILFLLILLVSVRLYAIDDLKILSSTKSAILFEYNPKLSDSSAVVINNENYMRLQVNNGVYNGANIPGTALTGKRIINVGVPSESGNTYQIIKSEYIEYSGKILPAPKNVRQNKIDEQVYEVNDKYYSSKFTDDVVSFGNYGLIRSLPVQQFIISPIQFDYPTKTIRRYTKIIFQVNFSKTQKYNAASKESIASGAVVNYDMAKNWGAGASQNLAKPNAASTVLASGKWFKFDAPDEGIYKITRSMLASYGIDASTVDPRTIKIYNNGGKLVPETVSANRPADLVENAIIIVGEDDGKFDDNDYILFYGRGTTFQDYDSVSNQIKTFFNPYSNHNYYWITSGGGKGKRIQNEAGLNESQHYVQSTSKAFVYKKDEKVNLAKSGRYFYGENFNAGTYTNKLDEILGNSQINYQFSIINADKDSHTIDIYENSQKLVEETAYGIVSDFESDYSSGYENIYSASYKGTLPDSKSILKFTFYASSYNLNGYLNYFQISYLRNLNAVNDFLMFYSKDTNSVIEYQLNGFSSSNINVFDVADYANVKLISNPVLVSGGEYRFQTSGKAKSVSKFIAVTSVSFKTPSGPVEVPNQNLRGIAEGSKYIIITHKNFLDQANRFKSYRENTSANKISTTVINVDQIYNEFSCGSIDVSGIRDFIKYAYDNWNIKPEYVLLFGDGDCDYKNIYKNGRNFIPPYETEQSLNIIDSYCSDDFYARISGDDIFDDIAIGRVNIQSDDEAAAYVDKVIYYENNSERSSWRDLITMVADDGLTTDGYEGATHVVNSEDLYDRIPPSYNIKKIYLSAYPTVLSTTGRKKPAVNQAIIDAMNSGTILFNFIGHGNSEVLTHETVFEKSVTIPQLISNKYFFLTAATCDFGYYDDPASQSSTEMLVLKADGGCIGALAAVRPVYGDPNAALNNTFYQYLLSSVKDTNNVNYPIGRAYFLTKSIGTGSLDNDRKFHLFGDPTIRLLSPQYSAKFDSINGMPSSVTSIQIKALSTLQLQGTIMTPDNKDWSTFNGEGILTVYDSKRTVELPDINYSMEVAGGVIFNGKVSIINGKFKTSFVVPKDISYENNFGKIILYFYNQKDDGLAFFNSIKFTGSDTSIVNDAKGPQIEIYFDNAEMKNSNLANSNSTLIVKLSDETGINTTGTGIGHKLEGILNKNENTPIDFTNYFTGDLDSGGKSGKINYKFSNLETGDYNLKVKAWDVFNNYNEATTDFTVVSGNSLEIRDVYNYPNPFGSNTTFTFQQNFAVPIDVKIKVYTVAGRMIKEIERNSISEKFVKIDWNGKDADNNQIANGTYLYKIIVKTVDGAFNKNVTGKLAVIR